MVDLRQHSYTLLIFHSSAPWDTSSRRSRRSRRSSNNRDNTNIPRTRQTAFQTFGTCWLGSAANCERRVPHVMFGSKNVTEDTRGDRAFHMKLEAETKRVRKEETPHWAEETHLRETDPAFVLQLTFSAPQHDIYFLPINYYLVWPGTTKKEKSRLFVKPNLFVVTSQRQIVHPCIKGLLCPSGCLQVCEQHEVTSEALTWTVLSCMLLHHVCSRQTGKMMNSFVLWEFRNSIFKASIWDWRRAATTVSPRLTERRNCALNHVKVLLRCVSMVVWLRL